MDLKDKVILVTGGSNGIGEEIVYMFSKEKCKLIFSFFSDAQQAKKVKEESLRLGASEVSYFQLDLRNNESLIKFREDIEDVTGHIDYLVNNAGVINWERFDNESLDEIENQIRTNLEGMIKITSVLLPFIKEGIINIASRAGHVAFAGRISYTASKFGVIGFTKGLSLEYPDLDIFSVSPGAVKTQMWNFKNGIEPKIVADYIHKYLNGKIKLKDGDLNIWEKVS